MFALAWVMLSFSQVQNLLVKITVKLPVVKVKLLPKKYINYYQKSVNLNTSDV